MPGSPNSSRSALDLGRDHPQVLGDERQRVRRSARRHRREEMRRPGPRRQRPLTAVGSLPGIAQ